MHRRGFTLIELMIVIAIISIVAAIAIPNMVQARIRGNEASAIGGLKTISTGEAMYLAAQYNGNVDYGMLSELNNTQLVDPVIGSGTKQGYIFQVTYSFLSSEYLWFGVANPVVPQLSGERYFCMNPAGEIFYTTGMVFALDTNTCLCPNNGAVNVGK